MSENTRLFILLLVSPTEQVPLPAPGRSTGDAAGGSLEAVLCPVPPVEKGGQEDEDKRDERIAESFPATGPVWHLGETLIHGGIVGSYGSILRTDI